MNSRDKDGKRFRSNRLGSLDVQDTVPPSNDGIVDYEKIDSDYDHAGGIQAIGHWLVVPLEGSHSGADARIVLYDLAHPTSPIKRYERDAGWEHAGTASITKLSDGRYLLVIGGSDANPLKFYVSSGTSLTAYPGFDLVDQWKNEEVETEIDDANWGAYQNINIVNQCDGKLFLIGMHNDAPLGQGADWVDVYRLEVDANTYDVRLIKVANRHVYCRWGWLPWPSSGIPQQCNLVAAAGVYIDPDGRLIVYATEHYSDGPDETVKFEEFRNQYWPTSCQGIEDAWAELYDDEDHGDRSLMIDFVDRGLEYYADFDHVEGFGDKTSSVRWCLPSGYRYALFKDHDFRDRLTNLYGYSTPQGKNVTSGTSSARFEGEAESGWYRVRRTSLWDGHGGPLTESDSPYLLAGTHDVPAGRSLTARGGATVLFKKGTMIVVEGALTVDGSDETIEFLSAMDQVVGMRIASQIVVRNGGEIKID
jgi:hypothetical protein